MLNTKTKIGRILITNQKKVALAKAEFLKALMLNNEIEKERIFVTELQKEDGNEYFEVVKTIWYFDIWEETK